VYIPLIYKKIFTRQCFRLRLPKLAYIRFFFSVLVDISIFDVDTRSPIILQSSSTLMYGSAVSRYPVFPSSWSIMPNRSLFPVVHPSSIG
jgi:hypothetical protein